MDHLSIFLYLLLTLAFSVTLSLTLSKRVESYKVFVKSFSGEKVRCVEEYIQPTLRETPSHVILHVCTNDVTAKQDPQQIAESIINLAVKIRKTVIYRYLVSQPETINTLGKQQI